MAWNICLLSFFESIIFTIFLNGNHYLELSQPERFINFLQFVFGVSQRVIYLFFK